MHDTLLANKLGALWTTIGQAVEAGFGSLSPSSAAALITLRHRQKLTATELGRILDLTQPASARLVAKLEAEGHVARQKPASGKEIGLRLTPKGRRLAEDLQRQRLAACDRLLAALTPADRRLLDRLLSALLAAPVTNRAYARHVCRFCDHGVCDGPDCPIGCAATALEHSGEADARGP
jgi:DNA-binding MarR family transcriptional regulator